MAGSGRTLLQALDYWAAAQPDKVLHTFLDDRGNPVNALTYSGLLAQSHAVAATLLSSSSSSSSGRKKGCGLRRGDRALLVFPPCLDFIVTFYACLRAGIVAVPVFPPGTLPEYLDDVFLVLLLLLLLLRGQTSSLFWLISATLRFTITGGTLSRLPPFLAFRIHVCSLPIRFDPLNVRRTLFGFALFFFAPFLLQIRGRQRKTCTCLQRFRKRAVRASH